MTTLRRMPKTWIWIWWTRMRNTNDHIKANTKNVDLNMTNANAKHQWPHQGECRRRWFWHDERRCETPMTTLRQMPKTWIWTWWTQMRNTNDHIKANAKKVDLDLMNANANTPMTTLRRMPKTWIWTSWTRMRDTNDHIEANAKNMDLDLMNADAKHQWPH